MKRYKLSEIMLDSTIVPNTLLFNSLHNIANVSWVDVNTGYNLDLLYYRNHSGDKYASPIVTKMLTPDSFDPNNVRYWNDLIIAIGEMYRDKWQRLYDAMMMEYNPLENYNMVESESSQGSSSGQNKTYAFNSLTAKPTDDTTATGENTRELTRSGNVGVTTSQQMLESEFEVRKHNFLEIVFNDLDTILCLRVY